MQIYKATSLLLENKKKMFGIFQHMTFTIVKITTKKCDFLAKKKGDLETLAEWWYSTSSLRLLNLTTQRKNLPWASRSTLKC